MKVEILTKLGAFLNRHQPLTEECHPVYLLVEIRKILGQANIKTASLLRFYADWCVHSAKDNITPEIRAIMTRIFEDIRAGIASNNLNGSVILAPFVSMEDFRVELHRFLSDNNLPNNVADRGWPKFRELLIHVLADQPINQPCAGIYRFAFTYGQSGHPVGEVIFEKEPGVVDRLLSE